MSTCKWRGDAPAVAQLQTITPANVAATNTFTLTCNGKTITFTATANTVANVTAGLVALLAATTIPEFQEVTAADGTTVLTLTANTPGKPFTITSSAAGGTATLVSATTTANSGPNVWSVAANWSGGAVPIAADDVIFENSDVDVLYGLDQSAVTLATLTFWSTYTGKVGLLPWNGSYYEYRDTYLKVSSTLLTVGDGTGAGSGQIRLNLGTVTCTAVVRGTGSPATAGLPALLLTGSNASNTLLVTQGSVGLALEASSTAQFPTLNIGYETGPASDVNLTAGTGCTLTTVNQLGGVSLFQSAITTLTVEGGTCTLQAGAVTTLTVRGGATVYDNSTGTITTATVGAASLIFDQDMRAKTITNVLQLYGGAKVSDPKGVVVLTAGFKLNQCRLADVTLDWGPNRTYTVA